MTYQFYVHESLALYGSFLKFQQKCLKTQSSLASSISKNKQKTITNVKRFKMFITDFRCRRLNLGNQTDSAYVFYHGLRTPGEEIAFTSRPRITSTLPNL